MYNKIIVKGQKLKQFKGHYNLTDIFITTL